MISCRQRTLRRWRKGSHAVVVAATWAVLLGPLAVTARAQAPETLQEKEQAQQKARELAAQLVRGVLDVQLRQLEENGLDQREIYRDILAMRNNLDQLVDEEMKEVVQLLVEAQQGTDDQRRAKFQEVRPAIREVVVRLMAERQRLQRRLKSARLAAEVRRLLEHQTLVYGRTGQAAELPDGIRQQRTLQLSEDQRDVTAVYFQLRSLLDEMRSWSGPVGVAAGRGLTLMQTARVEQDLKSAALSLESASFAPAIEGQRRVIRALQSLLEQIEAARGMVSTDRAALLQQIDQLLAEQEQTRDETLETDLQVRSDRDSLEDRQRQIHKQLGELSDAVQADASADPALLAAAKSAALESVDALFQAEGDEAAAKQSEVIGNLAQLRQQLIDGAADQRADRSSDELLEEERKLQAAVSKLAAAERNQTAAEQSADSNPAAAAAQEQAGAQALQQAAEAVAPSHVEARLQEAAAAQEQAAAALQNPDNDPAEDRQAVDNAREALEAARGELAVRLADVQRSRMAVEVGELARAAEALERAAAAQKEAARQVSKQEENGTPRPLSQQQAHELAQQQEQVRSIAKDIAAGVRRTAPAAQQPLAAAQTDTQKAETPLRQLTVATEPDPGKQEDAKRWLDESADHLENAAGKLRQRQGEIAEQLASLAGQQLSKVSPARAATQDALGELEQAGGPQAALKRALAKVQEARDTQLRAEGRSALAAARQTQRSAEQLLQTQQAARRAAQDYAEGRSNSPLETVAAQQQVAAKAAALADQLGKSDDSSSDPAEDNEAVAAQLRRAARAAEDAARAALLDSPSKAAEAQAAVDQALQAAARAAQAQAADAEQQQAGAPDASAQQQVAQQAGEASRQAAEAPQGEAARAPLDQAKSAAQQAAAMIDKQQGDAARPAQATASAALADAEQKIRDAIAASRQQQSQQQASLAGKAQQLAQTAAELDPAAARALREAAQAAKGASEASSDPDAGDGAEDDGDPVDATASPEASKPDPRRPLERAVASLAAREQAIRRDFDIAATLADLAREQQAARQEIRDQAQQLGQLSQQSAAAEAQGQQDPHAADKQAAAQSLQQATRQFAAAQRATGQGAVQISGQQQVVNPPIRSGLEQASQLPLPEPLPTETPGGSAEGQPQSGEGEPAEGQAGEGQPGEQGEAGSDGQGGENGPPQDGPAGQEGQPGDGQGQAGRPGQQPGQQQPGQQGQGGSTQTELGTSMVPPSADVTAQRIAGAEAMQQAEQALEGQPQSPPGAEGQGSPSPGGQPSPQASSQKDDSQPGVESQGGPEEATDDDSSDRQLATRRLEGEPWFSQLPPTLQQAIQARARRAPPRGYEERLRRYFESGQ